MAKKNLLKGIALDLLGSFVGRNNDVNGYWAIGKLRTLSDLSGRQDITIDLVSKTINPDDSVLRQIPDRYSEWFRTQLEKRSLTIDCIDSAVIQLRFVLPHIDRRTVPQTTHGTPYNCRVSIGHVSGATFNVEKYGWCDPHDPNRESRSNRASTVSAPSLWQEVRRWFCFE